LKDKTSNTGNMKANKQVFWCAELTK